MAFQLKMKKGVRLSQAQVVELDELRVQWREEFGEFVNGRQSVQCDDCGHMLIGDGAPIPIKCLKCFLPKELSRKIDWRSK